MLWSNERSCTELGIEKINRVCSKTNNQRSKLAEVER